MGRAFTAAERAVALDLSVSPKQAARQLGRSEGTIRSMRAKERLQRRPVPEDKHGTQYAARTYGCRCEPCLHAAREHERTWAAQRPLEAKVRKAAQTAAHHAAQPQQRNDIRRARSIKVAEIWARPLGSLWVRWQSQGLGRFNWRSGSSAADVAGEAAEVFVGDEHRTYVQQCVLNMLNAAPC